MRQADRACKRMKEPVCCPVNCNFLLAQKQAAVIGNSRQLLNTAFEEGTTVLSSGNSYQSSTAFPYIVRVSTNERYYINKSVYRIGKESRYVDCFISNNGAVSRSHADIISSNGRYFIVDKHTTNHTYINQQVIPEETQMELHDGDMITLANEVFTFHVQ